MPSPSIPGSSVRRRLLTWAVVALLLVMAAAIVHSLGLERHLSLDALRSHRDTLVGWYAHRPAATLAGFFALYVFMASLALPGAGLLTLVAGTMFGFVIGVLVVSFGAALAALLGFLAGRHLVGELVLAQFEGALAPVRDRLARDGPFHLLTLRLAPVVPFVFVNLVAGLVPIGTWRFWWITQLGMLPGVLVYVHAGTRLAEVRELSDVLSPGLVGAFALLAAFPWLARAIVKRLHKPGAGEPRRG